METYRLYADWPDPEAPPKGRAVSPEKKRDLIDRLYAAWLKSPHERLGQLIENSRTNVLFYAEDEALIGAVESRFK